MKITWYGTASLAVETAEAALLFDPFVPARGSKVEIMPGDYGAFTQILLTHAHLDHISSLPALCACRPREVWGTAAAGAAMKALGVTGARYHRLTPGDRLSFGDLEVTCCPGRHIRFDPALVMHTLWSSEMLRYGYNILPMLRTHLRCRERGETVVYQIDGGGRRVLLLGSMGLDPDFDYPKNADLLVLPYQGRSRLLEPAMEVLRRLAPKAVLLDHFDNTFPPLSREIDTGELVRALTGRLQVMRLEHGDSLTL